jgi:hypothetical protein
LFNMSLLNDDGAIQDSLQFQPTMLLSLLRPRVWLLIFHSKWSSFVQCSCLKLWSPITKSTQINNHAYIMTQTWFHKEMPSTVVIGNRYDDTFNIEPMQRNSCCCCCIYYIWLLATDSSLLQTFIVRLPLHADDAKKKQPYAL